MNRVQIGIDDGRFITVSYKDEPVLMFRFSTYGLMTKAKTESIYGHTNRYLASIDDEAKNDALFEAYKKSLDILSTTFKPLEIVDLLQKQVKIIREQLDFHEMRANAINDPRMPKCLDTPETYVTSNPKATTYLRSEAVDLTVYAAFIKTLAPIFGLACRVLGSTSGNTFKEMQVSEIILETGFDLDFPYQRLQLYARDYAARRKANTSTAVKFKMAAEDLETYILALFIIRRLVPFDFDEKMSILRYGYQFIEGKLKKLKRGYTDKFANVSTGGGGDSDSDSLVDHYRISEATPASIRVSTNCSLKNIEQLIRNLNISYFTVEDVLREREVLEKDELEISPLATPLIALCINNVIHRSLLDLIDRESKLNALVISSLMYRHHGYNDIADWLVHRRIPKEVTKTSLGLSGGVANRLDGEIAKQLHARYPHLPKPMTELRNSKFENPGLVLIDKVVRMVIAHDWPLTEPNALIDIRNSVAKVLINPLYK